MLLTRSEAVLELGKKLVAQLDASDDLLVSWMAHYIAQRIEAAERAPAEGKAAAQDACAKAILELWQHRSSLPDHLRPLGELESIQRTLALLDLDHTDHRYYPTVLREAATANADENAKQLLELAIGLDYSARLLIQLALRSAAHRAASQAEAWVELARTAGAEEGAERAIVKFVRGGDEETEAGESGQDTALLDKLSRLESFAQLAMAVASDLRAELAPGNADKK